MKKKVAALLCGAMCMGAFTGCSGDELAYLKLSKDMLDTMETCNVAGTMQAEVDMEALQDFAESVTKATRGEFDFTEMFSGDLPTGKKSIQVDYDMDMDLKTLAYDMAFDVTYEGKTYDLGNLYYSLEKGVYVTTDTLWGVYQMAEDLTEADGYFYSDAYGKELKEILAADPYITLVSAEEMEAMGMEDALPKEEGMANLYDAVLTFYEDVLDGFETGMVKKTANGFVIQADGQQAAQLLIDFLDFVAKNPDQVIDATEAYMNAVMEQMPMGTEEDAAAAKEEVAAMFEMARASMDDFVAAAADMSTFLQGAVQKEGVPELLKSFTYREELQKKGSSFVSKGIYDVTMDGKQVARLTSGATMQAAAKIEIPQKGISVDELTEKLYALEDKYNPVTGAVMNWNAEDLETALWAERTEPSFFGSMDMTLTEVIVKDGRAYLPLREICDVLGETVGWENSTKTPYVTKDGKRIDMKGLLQDSKAYVAVRDFEDLGYTVTYESENGNRQVTMVK